MRDASSARAILSLFTAPDRAESIAGDLTEEREARGSAWFWFHIIRTMFALFPNTLATAPVTALALVALGVALFVTLAFAGVAAVFLFPFIGSGVRWVLLSFFWNAALWTGISLVSIAPKHGMTACMTLAVAGEVLLIQYPLFFTMTEPRSAWSILVYMSALFAAAPLLAGGAIARWRTARKTMLDHVRLPLNASLFLVPLLGTLLGSSGKSAEWRDLRRIGQRS